MSPQEQVGEFPAETQENFAEDFLLARVRAAGDEHGCAIRHAELREHGRDIQHAPLGQLGRVEL